MDNTNLLKKVQIGYRADADIYQKFTAEMAEKQLTQSQLMKIIVDSYYNGGNKEKEIVEVPVEKIVEVERPRGEWEVNILNCNANTLGAFIQLKEENGITDKNQIIDVFVAYIEEKSGKVADKFIQKAKQLK